MTERNHERTAGEMGEERPRQNVLREMTEEEALEALAGELLFGEGVWEYSKKDADGAPVFYNGTIPPENAWEGKKAEALAAARAHDEVADAYDEVQEELDEARAALDGCFAHVTDEGQRQALLYVHGHINRVSSILAGVFRDEQNEGGMDPDAPRLFHAVYREMVRLRERREGEEAVGNGTL